MGDIVGRCGYLCHLCLAYKGKDQQRFSDGLRKYYRYRIAVAKCYCDGCMADDSANSKLIDPNCRVRACVIRKGLENCAYCEEYPCGKLKRKFVDHGKVAKKYGKPIPEEDYVCFVKPYEAKKVLGKIRQERGLE
jgi:hypothetical protein